MGGTEAPTRKNFRWERHSLTFKENRITKKKRGRGGEIGPRIAGEGHVLRKGKSRPWRGKGDWLPTDGERLIATSSERHTSYSF